MKPTLTETQIELMLDWSVWYSINAKNYPKLTQRELLDKYLKNKK
jgi:hypothetical protein